MVERRIKLKVDKGFQDFKDFLREKINEELQSITSYLTEGELTIDILNNIKKNIIQDVYNYENLNLNEDDFKKRKRVKNTINLECRCNALRANKMQCSRRKLGENDFCGTHLKGQPHGIISEKKQTPKSSSHIQLWAEEIKGIWYYIDDKGNVYNTNEILVNNPTPSIIAKYETSIEETSGEKIYTIPEFNI